MTLYIYIDSISFDDPVHLDRLYFFMTVYIYIDCIPLDDPVHLHRMYFFW